MKYKKCTKCGKELPATIEYFHKCKLVKCGLRPKCKECRSKEKKDYWQKKKQEKIDSGELIISKDGYKICTRCNEELPATEEFFCYQKGGKYSLYSRCRKCSNELNREYYYNNHQQILDNALKWYYDNKEEISKKKKPYNKIYYAKNKKRITKYQKKYREDNPDKVSKLKKDWYNENKDDVLERTKNYYKTKNGKASRSRVMAKRNRDLEWIELFINPFPDEIKVEYHHINNILTIPIPRILHRLCNGGRNASLHRERCNKWIKLIYGLDIDKLLSE